MKRITYKRILDNSYITNKKLDQFDELVNNREYSFFFSVRSALLSIIDNIGITSEDVVLLPSFIPEGVFLPFKKRKVNVVYYDITEALDPSIESIECICKTQKCIKLILIIHFFGKETNIDNVRKLLKPETIIIEDCAHSFFSKSIFNKNHYTGHKGDVSLFSLTKIFPIPDGGVIIINTPNKFKTLPKPNKKKSKLAKLASWFNYINIYITTKSMSVRYPFVLRFIAKVCYFMYYKLLCKFDSAKPITSFSMSFLRKYDILRAIKKRNSNIQFINAYVDKKYSFLVQSKDINPPGYYIVSHNKLKDSFLGAGVEVLIYKKRWFYYGKLIRNINEIPLNSINGHILLPINESLTYKQVNQIIEAINHANIN